MFSEDEETLCVTLENMSTDDLQTLLNGLEAEIKKVEEEYSAPKKDTKTEKKISK